MCNLTPEEQTQIILQSKGYASTESKTEALLAKLVAALSAKKAKRAKKKAR